MRERLALPDESHTGIQVVRVIAALVHRVIDNRVDRLVLHTPSLFANTVICRCIHLAGWASAGYVNAVILSTEKGVVRLGR